ncbi:type IA DNA topoisomerase [Sulfuracidifex metallicus]|uniref:type IA DNA topoisomerase n=1 Tax=Sulfuracidifex metallicus TaxID=47303 RepID=UPI00227284A7|nr:type IA DNA topoisomerase [Sulfuracidifex metallicus]MCY0850468.1 DNA topoisomerase [Sulfuracidifex metallicus]
MKLVITEKPSVAMDIAKSLGKVERKDGYVVAGDYVVTWAYGHLLEIDDSIAPRKWSLEDLPIFPERFKYKVIDGKKSHFSLIKKLLERTDVVVNCGDAGREGELIVREILENVGYKGKTLRLWTSEALTPDVVRREFSSLKPSSQFDDLYFSALARQHSDWIVGINLTRLVTLKAKNKEVWSVGRVQTPTLAMIVKRDREIDEFKPQDYYVVIAKFAKGREEYVGYLLRQSKLKGEESNDDQGAEFTRLNKEEAEEIVKRLSTVKYGKVKEVIKETKREKPPLLHSLTSLQREANSLYGLSAKKTLDIAQRLYEEYKVISYPRTDARYMGESNRGLVISVLKKLGKEELIPRVYKVGKRVFDSSKLTDHHAIIPLDKFENGNDLEKKVYYLVYRKFVGTFMDDYVYETTRVITCLGGESFVSHGKRNISLGWMSLYEAKENPLPELREGDEVKNADVSSEKRSTKPPAHYTDSSILKEMERLSLGTPATRASILETLLSRGYLTRKGKLLVSTEKGRELIEKLKDSKVTSPEMTGEWEKLLEGIYLQHTGEKGYQEFVSKIKEFVRSELKTLMPKLEDLGDKSEKSEGIDKKEIKVKGIKAPLKCKCGGDVREFYKCWKCSSCKSVVWKTILGKRITERQASLLFQGREVEAKGFISKNGKKFSAKIYLDQGRVKFKFDTKERNDTKSK